MILWQCIGFVFTAMFGTILHFAYSWTESTVIALFSAVNESTWEHMKLIFFPMFVFAIIEGFIIGKDYKNYWCIKLKGIILSLFFIPITFYTMNGVFGMTSSIVNIGIFFVSASFGFAYEIHQFKKNNKQCSCYLFAIALLCIIATAFFIFTFSTPRFPLFMDPITSSYGI